MLEAGFGKETEIPTVGYRSTTQSRNAPFYANVNVPNHPEDQRVERESTGKEEDDGYLTPISAQSSHYDIPHVLGEEHIYNKLRYWYGSGDDSTKPFLT